MTTADARLDNWRYVVPDRPDGLVVLGAQADAARSLTDALAPGPFPAVVAPDLGDWCGHAGARRALGLLAAAVGDGGWMFVGMPNRWSPLAFRRRGALSLRAARAVLRGQGMTGLTVYLPLPDQRHPALLVDADRQGALDHVFRHLFLTYLPDTSRWARLRRRALSAGRRAALVAPHAVRVRLAPAYCILATRPR